MELLVKDKKTALSVSDAVFACEYNEGLVHQVVTAQMNAMRSGNSAQKTRAEVRGGGKKPWKQKGTGRARAGTIRSPLWRSGGVIFAAKKRSYAQKVNKKMYKKAVCVIFSELYRLGRIVVVSSFACDSHKTKAFQAKMNDLGLANALVVTKEFQEYDYLGSRNLPEYAICDVYSLDPVSLLKFENIVMTEEAVKALEEQLA